MGRCNTPNELLLLIKVLTPDFFITIALLTSAYFAKLIFLKNYTSRNLSWV